MGSIGAAAWIAKIAFLALFLRGVVSGDLRSTGIAAFLLLGAGAWMGLPHLPGGGDFVTPALALIDIALVFAIFKGDVRLPFP